MKTFLRWTSRILLILLIGFFLLMSTDIFNVPGTPPQQILAYLINVIPSFLLLIPLFLLFTKEVKAAGLACIVLAVIGFFFFHAYQNFIVFIMVTALPTVIGCAFLYERKR